MNSLRPGSLRSRFARAGRPVFVSLTRLAGRAGRVRAGPRKQPFPGFPGQIAGEAGGDGPIYNEPGRPFLLKVWTSQAARQTVYARRRPGTVPARTLNPLAAPPIFPGPLRSPGRAG